MQAVEDDGGRERLTARSLNLYKLAAAALTDAIGLVVGACTPGATALKICSLGDSKITEYLQNVAKSIKDKGVAFPTCLSINSDACHFCPLPSDDTILSEKDIVKIEMACHIDGFIASQVHTVVVTPSPRSDRITRRAADVICAVNKAAEIISDVVGPGTKLKDFNEIIQGVAHCFSCTVLSISACRLLKQYDSKESLLSISTLAEAEFLKDRAYIIDIAFATEHGELELSDGNQTTVYKSMMNAEYQLEDERRSNQHYHECKAPAFAISILSQEDLNMRATQIIRSNYKGNKYRSNVQTVRPKNTKQQMVRAYEYKANRVNVKR